MSATRSLVVDAIAKMQEQSKPRSSLTRAEWQRQANRAQHDAGKRASLEGFDAAIEAEGVEG